MKHILVVDDDASVLNMVARALEDFRVTAARDPDEALAIASQVGSVDLLITDYLMPSMTGVELIGRLREQRPALKALVITGHGDFLDHEAPDWWQSEPHLAKPFRVQALRDTVANLIGMA